MTLTTEKSNTESSYCHNCGCQVSVNHKFCSGCGNKLEFKTSPNTLNSAPINSKLIISVAVLSAVLFCLSYFLNPYLIGKAPANSHSSKVSSSQSNTSQNNPEKDKSNPEDIFVQAETAIKNIQQNPAPTSGQLLEAVDLLSRILQSDPNNPWALIQMAELSFNQKMFDKSSDFYARYLMENQEDLTVRARYASSLTFAGKSEQAIKELDLVLKKDPDNFQALAFSAIANFETGQKEKASLLIQKAIGLAPNEEAKNRLLKFAEGMLADSSTDADSASHNAEAKTTNSEYSAFENYLRSHPIAGPKFAGLKITETEINLFFNEFPMEKMPPVVKDKFTNNVKIEASKVESLKSKNIVFRDQATNAIMAQINQHQ